jgi:ketosteroid isomerase-like protein
MTATMRIADMVDVSRGILSGPISRAQRNHVVAYGASGTSIYPPEGKTAMRDDDLRTALRSHWAASDANDFATEHQIYRTDAVLEYPQSGERIRGRQNIQASREAQPNAKRFTVRRMLGGGNLWISELVLTYDGQPFYVVSIMEFEDGEVVRETQYFGDPFEPGPSRAQWVERIE